MGEVRLKNAKNSQAGIKKNCGKKNIKLKRWEKPTLEDVSEKIMAQPYIRFT